MRVNELQDVGAPPALIDLWAEEVDELTDVQAQAVAAGAINGTTNLLVVAPTSSGKTFIAEMAAVSASYRTRRHTLFLVPFRALADEHYASLRERYGHLLSVVVSTGDWNEFDDDVRSSNFGVAVLTYERLIGLLVENPQILDRCGAVVVDEIQMLGDRGRGADLEMLLTQVLNHPASPRLVALSASLDRLNLLDQWLRATLVIANERPVPLAEGVLAPGSGRVMLRDGTTVTISEGDVDSERAMMKAISSIVEEGKQVLVFRTSIPKTQAAAEQLRHHLPAPGLATETGRLLDELEPSDTVEMLRRTLASRIGFHNGDLTAAERRAVERSFRLGECRVLVSTTTLAMGVNLPTDVVVIADTKRWIPDRGNWRSDDLTVAEYKNAAGRAGRLGLRSEGLAFLVAPTDTEQRQLVDYYCRGEVEAVESQLPASPLDDVAFGVLCAGLADAEEGLVDFISTTFAFATFYDLHGGIEAVREGVSRAVATCRAAGFVELVDEKLVPTAGAYVFARRHIPVAAATALSQLADRFVGGGVSRAGIAFAVASCDTLFDARPYIRWDRLRHQPVDPRPGLELRPETDDRESPLAAALLRPTITEQQARILARTDCLLRWADGQDGAAIARAHNGCPEPRVAGMGRTAAWLLEAVSQLLRLRDGTPSTVEDLTIAVRYGVPRELAPLAQLHAPGIGRNALMRLYAGDRGRRLFDPDVLLDIDPAEFDGLLRPVEVDRLRTAIMQERGESLRRRRGAQVQRAQDAAIETQLLADLYDTAGLDLEQAVADALTSVGIRVTRVTHQKRGEEDLQITHEAGTIVVSVTASLDPTRNIVWSKAREVLGAGVGINPVNYLCIGRPGFHSLAIEHAELIAREEGARRLLLIPIDVLAELVVRCHENTVDVKAASDLIAHARGLLTFEELDALTNQVAYSNTRDASA
jgi:replicative superfamily II helicase